MNSGAGVSEAYDHQREVQHQLGLYLDHPGGAQELARAHQHGHTNTSAALRTTSSSSENSRVSTSTTEEDR